MPEPCTNSHVVEPPPDMTPGQRYYCLCGRAWTSIPAAPSIPGGREVQNGTPRLAREGLSPREDVVGCPASSR